MDSDKTPINRQPVRRRGPIEVLADLALGFEERVLWRVGDGLRAGGKAVRRPFEFAGWAVRRFLVWPLQDEFELLSGPRRVLAVAGGAVVVVALGAGIYLAAGSGSSSQPTVAVVSSPAPEPVAKSDPTPAPEPAEPTLRGATPVFAPTEGDTAKVGAPKSGAAPANSSSTGSDPSSSASSSPSASAATGKISSRPSAAPGSVGAEISAIPGKPAGAKALAVAREFSGAFVVYETRGKGDTVRRTFADTATPELTKALLKRPPRQPADVSVPRAKVLNIVPGPSRGGVFTVSVSLLRVGVTSELRLEMEKLKDEGWRVTNVLG
jgi:hypothetical protein